MDSGRFHISSDYATEHNNRVEQERQAEHLRRCAGSAAYKRVYEHFKNLNMEVVQQTAKVMQEVNDQLSGQYVHQTGDSIKKQPVHDRAEPMLSEEWQRFAAQSSPMSLFMLGMLFADEDRLRQIKEDLAASKEMQEVNDYYDRQIIRLSGFEW